MLNLGLTHSNSNHLYNDRENYYVDQLPHGSFFIRTNRNRRGNRFYYLKGTNIPFFFAMYNFVIKQFTHKQFVSHDKIRTINAR